MLSALKIEMGRNTKKTAETRPFKFRDFKAIIKSKVEISKTKLQTIVQKRESKIQTVPVRCMLTKEA